MTKRARVSVVTGVRLNERELYVLKLISETGAPRPLSATDLARNLDCSVITVRNVFRSLEAKDLVLVHSRFLRNGGQLENEFEVTEEGARIIKADSEMR